MILNRSDANIGLGVVGAAMKAASFREMPKARVSALFERKNDLLKVFREPVEKALSEAFAAQFAKQRDAQRMDDGPFEEYLYTLRLPRSFDTKDPTKQEIALVAATFASIAIVWSEDHARRAALKVGSFKYHDLDKKHAEVVWRVRPEFDMQRETIPVPDDYDGPTVNDFVTSGRAIMGPIALKTYWRGYLRPTRIIAAAA